MQRVQRHPRLLRYGLAVAAVAVTSLVATALGPAAHQVTFLIFLPAIVLAAWFGGAGPGILASVVATAAATRVGVDPPRLTDLLPKAAMLLGSGVLLSLLIDRLERAQRRAEELAERAEDAERRARETLDSIADLFMRLDVRGQVIEINDRLARRLGLSREALTGRELWRRVPDLAGSELRRAYDEAMVERRPRHLEVTVPLQGTRWLEAHIIPDEDGVSVHMRDITERRGAEEAVRASEHRLHLALSAGRMGVWVRDLASDALYWSPEMARLYGVPLSEFDGTLAFELERVHPEDRGALRERMGRIATGSGSSFLVDYRIVRPDGTIAWLESTGEVVRDEQGRGIRLHGVSRDVSARRRTEAELEDARSRYELATRAAGGLIFDYDLATGTVFRSPALFDLLGVPLDSSEPTADWWTRRVHPEDLPRVLRETAAARDRGDVRYTSEYRVRHDDGGWVDVVDHAMVVRDHQGRPARIVGETLDMTARKQAERALQASEHDLRHASRRKDEFLAMLAHELRNPLGAISNAAQLLRRPAPSPSAQTWAREVIDRQVGHLARIVDDLLDVSRVTQGKIALQKEPLDLSAAIRLAVETVRPQVDAKHLVLDIAGLEPPLVVVGDLNRLAQVFGNLLNNAAKYSHEGQRVMVEVRPEDDEAVVTVSDTGIGIDAAMLPQVFELFAQAENALERVHGGLGIGLTLVKRLVEMHGGTVAARSEGRGRGSTFEVRMPVVAAPAPSPRTLAQPDERHVSPFAGRGVLVVDDNRDSAEGVAMMLTESGAEVRTCFDGPSAIAVADEFHPEVVLLDIGLPRMNGYDVARGIRHRPWGRDTVLVALTGWGQDQDVRRAMEAGFTFHVTKPVTLAALAGIVAPALAELEGD